MRCANDLAKSFAKELEAVNLKYKATDLVADADTLHVESTGASISELYESIRNASQNAEEDLLLMHAILRFLERSFLKPSTKLLNKSGENLIIELTLAGYLKNDSITFAQIDHITNLIIESNKLRVNLKKKYPTKQIKRWVIRPLASAIESSLVDHQRKQVLANLAYNYFLKAIDIKRLSEEKPSTYEATLYVAIEQVLLKNDPAFTRLNLINRYKISKTNTTQYAEFNQEIDSLFASDLLKQLNHIVDRNGAPFRILLHAIKNDSDLSSHIKTEKALIEVFDASIKASYLKINKDINRGIVRSVVFLIITKFLAGIAMEVPYDLMVHGAVMWLPLTVNLALPPLYMVLLRLTLIMPDAKNTKALTREISRILYKEMPKKPFLGPSKRKFSYTYNILYALMVVGVFVGVSYLLINLAQFEWIHLVIFFVFISTASFLGFRLSRAIRSIEVGNEAQTSMTVLRDFLYMPFVVVGRHITETYSKLKIVSRFLDIFVELPLKHLLSFIRQWGVFMSEKKDEL